MIPLPLSRSLRLLVLLLAALPVACGPGAPPVPAPFKPFDHIYVIVMENQSYEAIVGNPELPYINQLIQDYGLATNYTAVSHPSQPNYLALFSGSTQNISDDKVHSIGGRNVADQLEEHGKTWSVFAQNLPPDCFTGQNATEGADGPGTYVRRHNPAISFASIRESPARCARLTDFTHFDPAAANFAWIIPNDCNNTHDCSLAQGDQFLSQFVPRILESSAWQDAGLLFIVWDEAEKSDETGGGGHVPLLVISNHMHKPLQSPIPHNHYSLLRTIQDNWELGCLNQTCGAVPLNEFFLLLK